MHEQCTVPRFFPPSQKQSGNKARDATAQLAIGPSVLYFTYYLDSVSNLIYQPTVLECHKYVSTKKLSVSILDVSVCNIYNHITPCPYGEFEHTME